MHSRFQYRLNHAPLCHRIGRVHDNLCPLSRGRLRNISDELFVVRQLAGLLSAETFRRAAGLSATLPSQNRHRRAKMNRPGFTGE